MDTVERLTLSARLSGLLERLGGRPDSALADAILSAWSEPQRVYHRLEHLQHCLTELDGAPTREADRGLVELALWFHDAVYDPHALDNEHRSAERARGALAAAGLGASTVAEVARLVLLTRHQQPPDPADASGALVCDVDLSILGRPASEYDTFEWRIRREYAWVPEPAYRAQRARILAGFLARDPLFLTDHLRGRYETTARFNLQRAIANLRPTPP